jgi:hypothetical protein
MDDPTDPVAGRPHMPGYGMVGANEGTGLLPGSWATERLARSHDYWLATGGVEGRRFGLSEDDFTGSLTRWTFTAPT